MSSGRGIVVDETSTPLVVVTYPRGITSDDDVTAYIAWLHRRLRDESPFVQLIETRYMEQPVSAAQRRLIAASLEHPVYRDLRRFKLGDAVVMHSVLVRGAFGAMPANAKVVSPIEIFDQAAHTVPFLTAHLSTVDMRFTPAMQTAVDALDAAFEAR